MWTILTEAREIYKSPSGHDEESRFLEILLGDIHSQHARLLDLPQASDELRALLREGRSILDEVELGISAVKTQKRSRWKSFVSALKAVWGRDKIEGLMKRLGRLQSQVNAHLLYMTT